jgi:hypothetical protein
MNVMYLKMPQNDLMGMGDNNQKRRHGKRKKEKSFLEHMKGCNFIDLSPEINNLHHFFYQAVAVEATGIF